MASRRAAGADGSTTVEFVVVFTVALGLLLIVVQAAIFLHTRAVATTAATHGLDAARVSAGTATGAHDVTNQFLDQAGGWLTHRDVRVDRGATTARVRVGGDVLSVLPALPMRVAVTVTGPVERLVP